MISTPVMAQSAAQPETAASKQAAPAASNAEDKPASNAHILRDKIEADKKLVVAKNMNLTESEAKAFWPIYDDAYQKDLDGLNKRLVKLIRTYAGASLELGNVWQDFNDISFGDTIFAGSAFICADTPIGPIYLGYGRNDRGDGSLYLYLGPLFSF